MRPLDRWLLAIALVAIDLMIFFVPLTGLFAAYILLARPAWFRRWIEQLYTAGVALVAMVGLCA